MWCQSVVICNTFVMFFIFFSFHDFWHSRNKSCWLSGAYYHGCHDKFHVMELTSIAIKILIEPIRQKSRTKKSVERFSKRNEIQIIFNCLYTCELCVFVLLLKSKCLHSNFSFNLTQSYGRLRNWIWFVFILEKNVNVLVF